MAASIGEQLRLARESRGIGLREICDQTRISLHYLEAIEANDYKRLPGGVFNRSFIKAYAKAIGYDEREAIEGYTRYLREHGESSDDVATTPSYSKVYTDTPATRSPLLTVLLAIVILAVLTAAALAALYWFQRRAENHLPVNPQVTSRSYRSAPFLFFWSYKHIAPPERRTGADNVFAPPERRTGADNVFAPTERRTGADAFAPTERRTWTDAFAPEEQYVYSLTTPPSFSLR